MSRLGRDYAFRKVRSRILATAQVCAICGGAIDFDAPARSPLSPSVDHILPVSRTRGFDERARRRLALDPAGLRAAHYGCNSRRGNRQSRPTHISRSWA